MNIKMTWAFAGKLLLALIAAGLIGAMFEGSPTSGAGIWIVLIVVYAENEKQKRK